MNLKSLIYLLLFTTPIFSVAQKITGQVINDFDKTPIFGVTIFSDGVPFAFSDEEGKFEIEDKTTIKELTFSHLAFTEKTIKVSDFKNENQLVYLVEKATMLKEIEINTSKNTLTLEDIIKKSAKNFSENYNIKPYLAKINGKQIVMQNNEYLGYVEIDGLLYNFVPKDRNPFKYSFVLPIEIRKNIEISAPLDFTKKNKYPFSLISADLFKESFLDFQFATLGHPLYKKQKYTYKRLEDVEINDHEYYQIQFFQKKGINIKRDLFNVYGEMLISKEDFFIVKHKVSFNFDNINSNEVEILYAKKGVSIIPSTIKINTKIINSKYNKKGVLKQIVLTIDNSKTIDTKDITEQVSFNINYYLDEVKYDANYWKQKTQNSSTALIDNYLKTISEQDFLEGAKQKVLDTKSKYYTKEDEAFRIEQIKLHKEILKNIKL
jgi:hypothetical protein